MGSHTKGLGIFSTAMGDATTAASQAEVAIGSYNEASAAGGEEMWRPDDAIFRVGFGSRGAPKDALRVMKNGDVIVEG